MGGDGALDRAARGRRGDEFFFFFSGLGPEIRDGGGAFECSLPCRKAFPGLIVFSAPGVAAIDGVLAVITAG